MDLLKLGREIGAEAERFRWKLRLEPLVKDLGEFNADDGPEWSAFWRAANKLRAAVDELAKPPRES